MLASASLNASKQGLYEPSHGSAPDIAGKNLANPIATILSVAMMLRYSFDHEAAAVRIENAVKKVLAAGYRTGDIYEEGMKKSAVLKWAIKSSQQCRAVVDFKSNKQDIAVTGGCFSAIIIVKQI